MKKNLNKKDAIGVLNKSKGVFVHGNEITISANVGIKTWKIIDYLTKYHNFKVVKEENYDEYSEFEDKYESYAY